MLHQTKFPFVGARYTCLVSIVTFKFHTFLTILLYDQLSNKTYHPISLPLLGTTVKYYIVYIYSMFQPYLSWPKKIKIIRTKSTIEPDEGLVFGSPSPITVSIGPTNDTSLFFAMSIHLPSPFYHLIFLLHLSCSLSFYFFFLPSLSFSFFYSFFFTFSLLIL